MKKKKVLLFSFVFFLFYLKKKIQISNFKIWKFKKKKKCGIYFFDFIFMSRDRAKLSSHWAEILSQDHLKIRASEPLSRDPSHWAMIRLSQAKIYFKPNSKPPSHRAEIRAIEPRYEPSRVEPRYLSYSFVNKFKGFIKITHWV